MPLPGLFWEFRGAGASPRWYSHQAGTITYRRKSIIAMTVPIVVMVMVMMVVVAVIAVATVEPVILIRVGSGDHGGYESQKR